jgi:multiple sugar transport system permease protein
MKPIKPSFSSLDRTQWLLLAGLLLGAVAMMAPFWVMIVTSLTNAGEVLRATGPNLFVWPPDGSNYATLFRELPLGQYFWNSVFVTVVTTVIHVLLCAMAGYAFSRMRFPGREPLFLLVLITLMVPPQVNIVPLFFLMKQLHWVNTYWALIVPGLFGGFGVFLLRQWFNALPKELEEAALLDGCSPWQTFWKIALPLAGPALAALSIFVFIGAWNSFLWPLVVTHSDELRTLPVGLAALKESFRETTNWPLLMGASTLSVLPVVIVFMLGQKQFMAGVMSGSSKE